MKQQLPVVFAQNAAFVATSGSYRLVVATMTKSERYVVWLESKASKRQWQCCVSDMTQHAPPSIMLPMPAVMAAFKRAAETLKPSTREKLCVADAQDGHLQLTLRMVLSPELELDYTFDMAPLAVEAIEILAAKIRDVEDTIASTNQKLSALEKRLEAATATTTQSKRNQFTDALLSAYTKQ